MPTEHYMATTSSGAAHMTCFLKKSITINTQTSSKNTASSCNNKKRPARVVAPGTGLAPSVSEVRVQLFDTKKARRASKVAPRQARVPNGML